MTNPNPPDPIALQQAPVGGNICAVVNRGATLFGEHPAVICDGEHVSYAELLGRVRSAARELVELGVRAGDSVMSLTPNCVEAVVLPFAVAYVGAVGVPLNTMLRSDEIAALMSRVQPALFVVHPTFAETARAAAASHSVRTIDLLGQPRCWSGGRDGPQLGGPYNTADGPAIIVFTSGSTSAPKGCVKSHSNHLWSAVNNHLSWPRTTEDRELYSIPLSGIGFANLVMGPMLGGATIVLERFNATTTLDAMARLRTTSGFLPATMLDSLLREEDRSGTRDLGAVRLLQTGYAMSDRLRNKISNRFPGVVHYSYGLTEGGMSLAAESHRFVDDPTCVGTPCGIDSFAVVDEDGRLLEPGQPGEIVVSGPDVMVGYLDDPEATADALRGGWLHTGDLGYLDDTGALHFTGRLKDVIKSGGVNVSAAEVEQFLTSHPGVRDAAVTGVADDHWGEAVTAFVEVEPGHPTTSADLHAFCREGLAGFKQPKVIEVVIELPRNPSGKIAKDKLRSLAQGSESAQQHDD